MRTVNAVGDACPIPVVKTKRALETLEKPDMVEVLVDNETAVQNVTKFAVQAGKKVSSQKLEEHRYQILIDCTEENIRQKGQKTGKRISQTAGRSWWYHRIGWAAETRNWARSS